MKTTPPVQVIMPTATAYAAAVLCNSKLPALMVRRVSDPNVPFRCHDISVREAGFLLKSQPQTFGKAV